MKLFRRKKKEILNAKWKLRDMVSFRYKDDLIFGYVYDIKEDMDGSILYDIQVCGQCPWFVYNVKESELMIYMVPR